MSKSYLYFDTETTGFIQEYLPFDHKSQPHVVQLAMLLLDSNGREAASVKIPIALPASFVMPAKAQEVHGLSVDYLFEYGIAEETAVEMFQEMALSADTLVAHHYKFDEGIMRCAFARCSVPQTYSVTRHFCTMEASTPIMNLPPTPKMIAAGFNKPKPPKLAECIKHFFGEDMTDAHDALADVRACRRVHQHILTLNPNL